MIAGTYPDLARACSGAGISVQELPASCDIRAGFEVHEGKVGDLRGVIVDLELIEAHCHSSSAGRLGGEYGERRSEDGKEDPKCKKNKSETFRLAAKPRGDVVSEIAREVDDGAQRRGLSDEHDLEICSSAQLNTCLHINTRSCRNCNTSLSTQRRSDTPPTHTQVQRLATTLLLHLQNPPLPHSSSVGNAPSATCQTVRQ